MNCVLCRRPASIVCTGVDPEWQAERPTPLCDVCHRELHAKTLLERLYPMGIYAAIYPN